MGQLRQLRDKNRQLGTKLGRAQPFLSLPWRWPWYYWGPWAVLVAVGIGGVSGAWLLRQSNSPGNCNYVFWPFASAAFRLYCAQEAADTKTLEGIIEAINLVDVLPADHPLAPEINRRLQAWSSQALDLAEASFQAGDYDRAVKFAREISPHAAVYAQVQSRLNRWETIWEQGQRIYNQAETALRNLDWREAFYISLKLIDVDCRYWSDVQARALGERIIQVQREDRKLGEARRLMARGGRENLIAALEIIEQVKPNGDIYPGAMKLITQISEDLVALGEDALRQGDYQEAQAAAQAIPANIPTAWGQAQELIRLATATELAQMAMGENIPTAIQQARGLSRTSPLYDLAQTLIKEWQGDLQVLQTLALAQKVAQSRRPRDLMLASNLLQTAPLGSSFRQSQLTTQQQEWRIEIQTQEDQPILDQAEALARLGTPAALQQAIILLQRIRPGRALYAQAQNRLKAWLPQPVPMSPPPTPADPSPAWLQQAQAQAQLGTPAALALAIETVNQVPPQSPLRSQADQLLFQWGNQILQSAQDLASQDLPQAMATAQLIPANHPLYGAAQRQIEAWQQNLTPPPTVPPPAHGAI